MAHVIIVGGGFGGLSAARALRGAPLSVTLIDKRNYHLFRPMLYQVATGLLSADEISGPLRSILSHQQNVDVLLDEVTGISPKQRIVHLKHRELAYDFLILATGIRYNYFGHDEWRAFAPGLESLDDADVIRSKILLAFERAEAIGAIPEAREEARTEKIRRLLTFALVGAGTVGVEMAGTLAEMSRMALAHDFRHIDPKTTRILLYEAAPRILPTYPEVLSLKAQRHLESLGVEVFTNARVTSVDSDGIVVGGQRVPAGTVLWGAGVVASPAGRWLGVETDKSGKVIVQPDLSVPGHPEVFVIGDTAHLTAAGTARDAVATRGGAQGGRPSHSRTFAWSESTGGCAGRRIAGVTRCGGNDLCHISARRGRARVVRPQRPHGHIVRASVRVGERSSQAPNVPAVAPRSCFVRARHRRCCVREHDSPIPVGRARHGVPTRRRATAQCARWAGGRARNSGERGRDIAVVLRRHAHSGAPRACVHSER